MANWRGISRGNFSDPRIRRNWNRLATLIDSLFDSDQFEIIDGVLTLTGGLSEKWAAFDEMGGFVVPQTADTVLFDTVLTNTDVTIFVTFASGELTLDGDGDAFQFSATVSVRHAGLFENDFQCKIWLERDTGSG